MKGTQMKRKTRPFPSCYEMLFMELIVSEIHRFETLQLKGSFYGKYFLLSNFQKIKFPIFFTRIMDLLEFIFRMRVWRIINSLKINMLQ